MNTDKEKIYSRAVSGGIVSGMGISLVISGIFYAVSQRQDAKIGGKMALLGVGVFVAGLMLAPPIAEINYLKGK